MNAPAIPDGEFFKALRAVLATGATVAFDEVDFGGSPILHLRVTKGTLKVTQVHRHEFEVTHALLGILRALGGAQEKGIPAQPEKE